PSKTILSPINLNKIYDICVKKTNEQLKSASPFPATTCDIWCDQYKHRSLTVLNEFNLSSNNIIVLIINMAGEVLVADLSLSYDDVEDTDQLDNEKENSELELYSINDPRSSKFDLKKTQILQLIILMSFIL
ncbi:unnamed protein product, partial [Rotaria magnacalcarata]